MTGNDPLSTLVTEVAVEESIAYTFTPLPPIMPPNPMMARRWNNMAKEPTRAWRDARLYRPVDP
ncbi:hypothetical protein [Desulfocapsa sulfexigens]|uniref:hypothetical protein n=1 Tax=Desulfocapsa sulfexigens TaxID=65555 RepID=UPI000347A8BA|nr:hypothetical protein [Desulfocapsa sulfexigens]